MKYSLHLLFVILFLSCEGIQVDDLLGDFSDENAPPTTTINQAATTYYNSSVSLYWAGNDYATSFSYRLEPLSYTDTAKTYTSWSDWDTLNTVTLTNLDDGDYNFHIKSRYTIENEEIPLLVPFSINAIISPALRMYPLYQQVSIGESYNVYIYVEDVVDLTGMQLHVSYPASLNANTVAPGSILSNSAIFFDTINSTDGTIELISTAENFTGYTGSGSLAKITFIAGSSASLDTLHINDSSVLRNSGNLPITILNMMYGLIEVVE